MTNLTVARVFTIVNHTQSIPEAINIQFTNNEIHRIEVHCPWLPLTCDHCKQIGHSLKRCPTAPIICTACNSVKHITSLCPRVRKQSSSKPALKREYVVKVKASAHSPLVTPVVLTSEVGPSKSIEPGTDAANQQTLPYALPTQHQVVPTTKNCGPTPSAITAKKQTVHPATNCAPPAPSALPAASTTSTHVCTPATNTNKQKSNQPINPPLHISEGKAKPPKPPKKASGIKSTSKGKGIDYKPSSDLNTSEDSDSEDLSTDGNVEVDDRFMEVFSRRKHKCLTEK